MSSYRYLYLLLSVLSLAFASGCADDLRGRKLFDEGAGEVTIEYSVENITLTRNSGTEDMESKINHVYLLFYSETASIGNSVPIAAVRAEISPVNPEALIFKMPLQLQPSTNYQLLALANADDYVPERYGSFADYLQSWSSASAGDRGELLLSHSGRISTSDALLPMLGKTADGSQFRFSVQNGSYQVSSSLSFRRMVSRIDVANMVKSGFTVEGVALCNWRDAISVASMSNNQSNRAGNVCGILSEEGDELGENAYVDMPEAGDSGIQQLQRAAYCMPSVCYDSYASDKESTALIIKARYGDDNESSYYRVNVGISGNEAEVKANSKYLVAIQSVRGKGASTAKEAYTAEESPIVLSVVEDWDLDGCFAMDDNGNFIVLSTGRLEFEGDEFENREVKVLTSKGLSWDVTYTARDEASDMAFQATKLSESSMAIGPTGKNTGESALSGIFTVAATTTEGDRLSVEIAVSQQAIEEVFEEPTIPEDMPFALIPESYDRVKIDHVNKTIEIDGFDPDCFNSFIDVPFKVYVNPNYDSTNLSVTTTLQWPLEGIVSKNKQEDRFYCSNSFATQCKVFSKTNGKEMSQNELGEAFGGIGISKDQLFYISIGAMAPDDPAIERRVTISGTHADNIEYKLTIKPRSIIIDDVVISDDNGNSWIVCDRNIQNINSFKDYVGRKADGAKYQAYNYLEQSGRSITIPFKFSAQNTSFTEGKHTLYWGVSKGYSSRGENVAIKSEWLQRYVYKEGQTRTSPFYETGNYDQWKFPDESILKTCSQKMSVSKLRMFLVSEVPVKSGRSFIPVCCYWPYYGDQMEKLSTLLYTYGYYADSGSGNTESLVYIYCDKTQMQTAVPTNITNSYRGLLRLVRPLTTDELKDYKTNYLGYGSQPHKLTICHPDSYESEPLGWLPD